MDEPLTTTLDRFEEISVPGDVFRNPSNEYWALLYLWHGLEFLYHQAVRCDNIAREAINLPEGTDLVAGGNHPVFERVPKTLLTSAYHWYAVSACQYVRLVGAIAFREDQKLPEDQRRGRSAASDYVESVIPEVKAFRDKVAAHFAWATRNKNDNDAERVVSILPSVAFAGRSFQVMTFQVGTRRNGKVSDSSAITPWSIPEVHERLRKRYWPQVTATEVQPQRGDGE